MDKVAELIKAGKVKEIADMRDETDLTGLKLTIDLKRGADPDKLMAKLFRMTPLQDAFVLQLQHPDRRHAPGDGGAGDPGGVDRLADGVACGGGPTSSMKKKQDKLHLLKGLKRILLDIDKAIQIIRETEEDAEVIPNLMIGFGIDQVQAEYVAEIKLRNINKEYILKRIQETDALEDGDRRPGGHW